MIGCHCLLVDGLGAGRIEFMVPWHFHDSPSRNIICRLSPGSRVNFDMVRADGCPAVGDGIRRCAAFHDLRVDPNPGRDPGNASRWVSKPASGFGAGEVGEVVAPFTVFGLVVDDAVFHFDLADVEIALEIGGIVPGIPQAKLDAREKREIGRLRPVGWSDVSCQISRVSPSGTK